MKKWYSYIILLLVCIGFASCQDNGTVPEPQTDGRVSVHLQIALPGGDPAERGAQARDFTDGGKDDTTSDQKALSDDDVFVLVFQNDRLIDQVKGLKFDVVSGSVNPSNRTLTGTFVQPETDGELELVVLTNLVQNNLEGITNPGLSSIQAFFDGKEGSSPSPSEVYEGLIYQYGSPAWDIKERRIPMWGTTERFQLNRANELSKSCNLHRAVAKLGFLINAADAKSEGRGIDGFMITDISISGVMDKGYCVSQAPMSGDYYTAPYVPPTAAGIQTVTYSNLNVDKSYKDRIYLPEQLFIEDNPLTITVSYTYKGKSKTKEIPFEENVIRNHSYLYNITSVTPDELHYTLQYRVADWDSEVIDVPSFN